MKEERSARSGSGRRSQVQGPDPSPVAIDDIAFPRERRLLTGMVELDRVLGGGVVPGSVVLIGGDPGIGKSTLLLKALPLLARPGEKVLYVSGEESAQQIKMRGERLGVHDSHLFVLPETSLEVVLQAVQTLEPIAVVVDSVQTLYTDQISSAPGSISQVQEVAAQLMRLAKNSGVLRGVRRLGGVRSSWDVRNPTRLGLGYGGGSGSRGGRSPVRRGCGLVHAWSRAIGVRPARTLWNSVQVRKGASRLGRRLA